MRNEDKKLQDQAKEAAIKAKLQEKEKKKNSTVKNMGKPQKNRSEKPPPPSKKVVKEQID